jgi:hypothetical protein|tara:strand:- start:86 stop:292 length:207 start_codon:yes stop_codon:yes gene_type:complete
VDSGVLGISVRLATIALKDGLLKVVIKNLVKNAQQAFMGVRHIKDMNATIVWPVDGVIRYWQRIFQHV